MSTELSNKIEAKIPEIERKLKENNEIIANLYMSIKTQSEERKRIQNECHQLLGLLQGWKVILTDIKNSEDEIKSNTEDKPKVTYGSSSEESK